jgi:eukaryotic-like serine/threonine-protein kinase
VYLTPGQIFVGRYQVDRFIAEGGMGAVFAGMHIATEARVAIKVLRPSMLGSPAIAKQFALEAKIAARVRSPHIVQVLDAGNDEETGLSFLVMELLEGRSMEQLVTAHGALGPEHVVRYLEQVASGLDGAHRYMDEAGALRPIVHRDLKPENLFVVEPTSTSPTVKILDFGIAKVLSSTSGVSQDLRGTPLYMACEQATGQPVTPQTDIWALGLVAFYLLTGDAFWKSARDHGTLASLVHEITTEPVPPASVRMVELGLNVQLPAAFDTWFARCLQRRPELRFASAGEAIRALAEVLGVKPQGPTVVRTSAPPPVDVRHSLLETAPTEHSNRTMGELSVANTQPPAGQSSVWRYLGFVALGLLVIGALSWVLSRTDTPDGSPQESTLGASAVTRVTSEGPALTSSAAREQGANPVTPTTAVATAVPLPSARARRAAMVPPGAPFPRSTARSPGASRDVSLPPTAGSAERKPPKKLPKKTPQVTADPYMER